MRALSDTRRWNVAIVVALASALAAQQSAANAAERFVTIRGRVIDANGEPLPKAGVAVSTDPDFSTATALASPRVRCAADGSFEVVLDRTNISASTELLIAAPGKVAFEVPNLAQLMFAAASRHPSRVDVGAVCLPDGFTMTGRVRGPDGKPLAGARIRATDCLSRYPGMVAGFGSRATTNASGVFVLGCVFAQAMAITVNADGCYEKRLPCVDLAQPLDVQLQASGFVEGTLLDEAGQPADGLVRASYEFLGSPFGGGVRAVAGKWKLPITQPCRLFVHASRARDGSEPWATPGVTSNLLPGPTHGVELRFGGDAQGFTIRGVDGEGKRVAPIRAACLPDSIVEHVEDRLQSYVTSSGADGAVHLLSPWGGRGGDLAAVVLADGFAPFLDKAVVWQDGGSYEAKLVPECRLAGHVLDAATGKPVAGALVTCQRVPPEVERGPELVPVVAAADGSFTWRGLTAEPCVVTARHPDGTVVASQHVKWKAAGEQQEVALRLPAGVTVSGKLTGPLQPRWCVQLAPPSSDRGNWFNATGVGERDLAGAVTLVAGAFRFEHRGEADDELLLVVPPPPRQGSALRVLLDKVLTRKDDEVVDVDVDVSKLLPGAITGKVTLRGADFPVGRLAVVAVDPRGDMPRWGNPMEPTTARSWQLAGSEGAFRVPVVAGKYTLHAIDVATGVVLFLTDEIEVAAGAIRHQDLAIDVVEVQVRCEAAGRKQLGAERVEVRKSDQRQRETTLFGGGRYGSPGAEIDQVTRSARLFLPPGTCRLRAGVGAVPMQGMFGWGTEPAAEETIEATPGKVNEVTLELPDPADPTGR